MPGCAFHKAGLTKLARSTAALGRHRVLNTVAWPVSIQPRLAVGMGRGQTPTQCAEIPKVGSLAPFLGIILNNPIYHFAATEYFFRAI